MILLFILPALIAAIYILPPLYVRAAYPVPQGKVFSQYALGQLYNYDEYGMYQPIGDAVAAGRPPTAGLFTYEGRNNKTLLPYFAPFSIIALFKLVIQNNEFVMPALDVVFAFIGFYALYFFTLGLAPSRKTAMLASTLTLLPLPLLRVFELAGMLPANELLRSCFFSDELPMMSRTYSPQMTFPLMLFFLILARRVENGDNRKRIIIAAGAVLALSFYFAFFLGVILSLICAKMLIAAAASKDKARVKSVVTVCAAGALLSLHCLYAYTIFNSQFSPSVLDKYLNAETFNRYAPANIAALLFFAALYAVHCVPRLKKTAFFLALLSMPIAVYYAQKGGAIGVNFYFFTPAVYLLLAASLPKGRPLSSLFLAMSACVEAALLIRYATGKTHADVHYFYRTFFLQFVPALIAVGGWTLTNTLQTVGVAATLNNPRFKSAAFILATALIIGIGAAGNIRFASMNRQNYFISADAADAAKWLRTRTKADSVVMSLDAGTNIYIQLTSRRSLFLPRAGMSMFSLDDLISRLSVASKFLDVNPDKIDWHVWQGFGYYMFELYTTNPKCREAVRAEAKAPLPTGSGRFRLDYIWYGPAEKKLATINPDTMPQLNKVYSKGEISIYQLAENSPLFAPRRDLR